MAKKNGNGNGGTGGIAQQRSEASAAAHSSSPTTAQEKPSTASVEKPKVAEVKVEKPITAVTVTQLGSMSLKPYSADEAAAFGNSFAVGLIAQAGLEAEAAEKAATAGEAKQYLAFELTRCVFDLHKRLADAEANPVDIYNVFSSKAEDVKVLNRNVLVHLGLLERKISKADVVYYQWKDKQLADEYEYSEELKKEDEEEHTKRFNNRKRLNSRLADAYKAGVTLLDQGLTAEDMFYSEDSLGNMVPTVKNAPKSIGGDKRVFQMNTRKPVTGATLSPTMASLIKLAADTHKGKEKPSKGSDAGETRSGEAKMGISDEAFGRMVNTVKEAITVQEGTYSDGVKQQILSLGDFLAEVIGKLTTTKA